MADVGVVVIPDDDFGIEVTREDGGWRACGESGDGVVYAFGLTPAAAASNCRAMIRCILQAERELADLVLWRRIWGISSNEGTESNGLSTSHESRDLHDAATRSAIAGGLAFAGPPGCGVLLERSGGTTARQSLDGESTDRRGEGRPWRAYDHRRSGQGDPAATD